jgi:hypothetical protein
LQRVTIYGPLKHRHDQSRAYFSFKKGTFAPRDWDVNYGSLYVSEEHDWLQVSTAKGVRSIIRDLGARDWADTFIVPYVEPFPILRESEQRRVTVDASGADGEDGEDGRDGEDAPSLDGTPRLWPRRGDLDPPRRPKRDGVPKVDPIFVKAVVGHMYVVHVVDDAHDFYVLFRVESLVRGDNCTISWKRVPSPQRPPARMG